MLESDALMKHNQMGGHWRMINIETKQETFNTVCHKEWTKNTVVGADAILLLEFLVVLVKKVRKIDKGKVTAGLDNRKVCAGIVEEIKRTSKATKDAEAEIAEMKDIIRQIKFEIEFKLLRGYAQITIPFSRNPLQHIMKVCDEEA